MSDSFRPEDIPSPETDRPFFDDPALENYFQELIARIVHLGRSVERRVVSLERDVRRLEGGRPATPSALPAGVGSIPIPSRMATGGEITPTDLWVYFHLGLHVQAVGAVLSQDELAEWCGLVPRTVRTSLAKLEGLGYIRRVRDPRGGATTYELVHPEPHS